jgi:hypothetical protein
MPPADRINLTGSQRRELKRLIRAGRTTHPRDRVDGLLRLDDPVRFYRFCSEAKKARATINVAPLPRLREVPATGGRG